MWNKRLIGNYPAGARRIINPKLKSFGFIIPNSKVE
jgi:hypothetical protein